ncbi:hypothetical protein RFI_10529 [Reticulomyxa filosa]|uniref:Uncharacterized protein n=1 Tax=Reticulomyxa filosa TaxID=46433 RepID=X6NMH8_RETFI|nr:hypothetical protein RFI_10529 [Reticulomyxa filosa]|eukprot:ETO26607.1 hypothetical protein RFI_10529 [Reticulomyxa filosa]
MDFIIVGTNDGRLCFYDVRTHKKTWIEIGDPKWIVNKLELVIDIRSSSVLVRCYDPLALFKPSDQSQARQLKQKSKFEMGKYIHYEYFMLLLERPSKHDKNSHRPDPYEKLNGITPEILAQSGFVLKNSDEEIDPATITNWDCIVQCFDTDKDAFSPQPLHIGDDQSHIQLSVYHNTGSIIADPHQHTPTPSEAAAAKLGLKYPKRRIVAQNEIEYQHLQQQQDADRLRDPHAPFAPQEDPIATEHARSCVHFGVLDMDEGKLTLHAIDEIHSAAKSTL